jgi:hypothetical protein
MINFRLPESGVEFPQNILERRSFDAFKFLQKNDFSIIYFTSSAGIGYYSINSHQQGLLAPNSKFILGMDTLPLASRLKIESDVDDYLVIDILALKEKFMIEKSIENSVRQFH